ncbi:complement resistance protein TraT [Legionella septentrionalis]|uniref:complement resistance protein TraT n=1 Tax=Legionella septentrionalis TaxID=2498109 RepID=UPI000F8CF61B|nr:complement resistance protein TraT [Legionella septentrionalis]RUQ92907.1 conjugal transfer protein TraT [Legionella septentrionalis]RUR10025.1 conjugal transfer protein TraT [Legionella septentrionalis]
MNSKNRLLSKAFLASAVAVLTGCAATQTALEHRSLQVSTKQSETIFLDPVPSAQKTVYVSVKNTSDEEVDIAPQLKTTLGSHGYKVVNNPNSAHYLLQANVLKVGKMSVAASQSALGGGYGSAIAGAVAGTAVGSFTHTGTGMIAGGLAGGVIGLAADSLMKDVNYTMITDIQISEKVGKGVKVNEQLQSHLKNGSSTVTSQTSSRDSQYQRYRTRVISNANKVNLKFADARPALEQGLVKVISGIF